MRVRKPGIWSQQKSWRPWFHGLSVVTLLYSSHLVHAASWRSALYPEDWTAPTVTSVDYATDKFLQDFSFAGYHMGEAPIPQISSPVFNVTDAPYNADKTGVSDSTTAIQAAINAAQTAGGGVVYLPAGTYRVAPPSGKNQALLISAGKIVFRGDGPSSTHVLNSSTNMRGKSILLVQATTPLDWRSDGTTSALSADLNGPATVLPVAEAALFAVGDWVSVRNDATDAWVDEHNEPDWTGQGADLGGLAYLRQITAVGTDSLTIDIPTRYALKTRDAARVVKMASPLTEVGLENFSIANIQNPGATGWGEDDYNVEGTAAYSCHAAYAIRLTGAANSWITSVASYAPDANTSTAHYLSNGIRLDFCRSVTIAECYFQRPQYGGGGGNGYAYRFEDSGDNLVENCTAEFSRHGYLFSGMATAGNVLYRCIDRQTARYTGPSGSIVAEGRGSEHHAHFSHSNLIDSCTAESSMFLAVYRPFGTDPKHDITAAHTVFWNVQGRGDSNWQGALGNVVVASQQSRYGYVIGTRGTRSEVNVGVYYGSSASATKTAPVDFVEGVGEGSELTPASLFEDQVLKRLSHVIFRITAGESNILYLPAKTATLTASVTNGPPAAFDPGAATYTWSVFRAAGDVTLSATTGASVQATLATPGLYEFKVNAAWNGETASDSVVLDLRETSEASRTFDILATKDTTIRNGTFADTAFGTEKSLQMKFSESADVQRDILLQFAPMKVSAADLQSASLLLAPTNTPNGYTGALDLLTDTSWNENTTSWNTQPAGGAFSADWLGVDGSSPAVDITSAVKSVLSASTTAFTLRLRATTATSGDGVIAFRSKEGSSTLGPRLRMIVNAQAIPSPASPPPTVGILTRKATYSGRKVTIRGTVKSKATINRLTLTVKRGKTVRCKVSGQRWTARTFIRLGRNKLTAVATDSQGLIGRATAVLKAKPSKSPAI